MRLGGLRGGQDVGDPQGQDAVLGLLAQPVERLPLLRVPATITGMTGTRSCPPPS